MPIRYREPAIATLVVGLGGAGVRVLRQLKQLPARHPELDGRLLGCFGIDTEPGMQHRDADTLPPLDDPELLVLDGLEVRRMCVRLAERGSGRTLWPEIEAWLPDPGGGLRLVDGLAPTGEALLRPLGRLVYWRYEDVIRTHFSRALRALPVERGPGRLEGVRRVVIVASAGGGTGSGLLGELVDLVCGYDDVIELIVALVIPAIQLRSVDETRSDMRTPRRRRLDANTYACLKEVYHLRAGTIRWQGSAEGAARRQRRERWCERLFLSDDATGEELAKMLAFNLLRAGQCRLSRLSDRVTEAEPLDRTSERRWSVFSFAASQRVDMADFPLAISPATPAAADPRENTAGKLCDEIDGTLGTLRSLVLGALQKLTADERPLVPSRQGDRNPAGFVGDVLEIRTPALRDAAPWQTGSAWSATKQEIEKSLPQQREAFERYVSQCAPGPDDARLDGLRQAWKTLCEANRVEEGRGWFMRLLGGVTPSEVARRDEKLAPAFIKKVLIDGGDLQTAFEARVLRLLIEHTLGPSRLAVVPPAAATPSPLAEEHDPQARLTAAMEQAVLACRARLFDVSASRRERLGLCVAVVPRRRDDIRAILADRVPELLGCDVELVEHDVPVVWLYHEDPFHEPKDIVGIQNWYDRFRDEPHREMCFTDRRFLREPRNFTELVGEQGLHGMSCGNTTCRHDIRRVPRRAGSCPACGQWVRSRCGNETCTLENLHLHPQAKARSCPGCGGINQAAWWACSRHGKIEHLVSVEKPRCPACIDRHHDDPVGYPEACIGLRPDVGRYRECPGCAARREQEPEHQSLIIGPDLLPFVVDGVNGHDHERFVELAHHYHLDDQYRCPRCRCFLIPVHHAHVTAVAYAPNHPSPPPGIPIVTPLPSGIWPENSPPGATVTGTAGANSGLVPEPPLTSN